MDHSVRRKIEIVRGDIARQKTDAIVCAGSESLLPRTPVATAIHRNAGQRLTFECAKLGGCKPGQVKITPAFRLDAKWVLHTVGPKYIDGAHGETALLESCYARALQVAVEHHARSIAFPSIATGALGYPLQEAAQIAVRTVARQLEHLDSIERVIFVLLKEEQQNMYQTALDELFVARSFNTVGTATVWAPQ